MIFYRSCVWVKGCLISFFKALKIEYLKNYSGRSTNKKRVSLTFETPSFLHPNTKTKPRTLGPGLCIVSFKNLCRMNCFGWTNICTCTAVGAGSGVNFINIAFADGLNRTLINTATACDAVFINYVCHFSCF